MSRARLFQRAANWLKNCVAQRKQIEDRERRRNVGHGFGQLEDRIVLDADFSFDGINLVLDNYTSLGSEALAVSETATHYEFALAEGVWNGTDSGPVSGDGTSTLTVGKGPGGGGGGGAGLNLDLVGIAGSNVVTYNAYGSVIVTDSTGGITSGLGLAPFGGVWTSSFDNNLGDFLSDSMDTSFNDDLALSGGGVSYRQNGTEFGVLDTLDLDGSTASGGDDVELDPTASVVYPTLTIGDILSWTGTGTFTLEDGETFDSLFTASGTFSNTIDGGSYSVNIATGSVVETITSIGAGIDVSFGAVDFDDSALTDVSFTGGNIGQSGAITASSLNSFVLDGAGILLNDTGNDFNSVAINNGDAVSLFDMNDLGIAAANGVDLAFESTGMTTLNGDVSGTSSVMFTAGNGVMQAGGVVDTPDFFVHGAGDFSFSSPNQIGNGAPGIVGFQITDGSFLLSNDFDVELTGDASVQGGVFSGDLSILTTNDDVTQDVDTPVVVGGVATFDVGTGQVCLEFGDGNADTVNDNDIAGLVVQNAGLVEVVTRNGMAVGDVNSSDQVYIETEILSMELVGNIVAPNGIALISGAGIEQTGGSITAPTLLMNAFGDATLGQANSLGNGGDGIIAGESTTGEWYVNNQLNTRVDVVTYTRKDGSTVTATGITALKAKVKALQILITAAMDADTNIVLDSEDGAAQSNTGILTAAGIVLVGDGNFFLTENNALGSAIDPGKFAADVLGSIDLTNLFGLVVASVACGPTVYTGVNVGTGGMYTGDLTLDTSAGNSDVSQESDAPIIVEGETRIDAGTGNVCLGKGDTADADLLTNNDFNTVFISSANSVELADANDIFLEELAVSDNISIEAGGKITLNDNLTVQKARLHAGDGLDQAMTTFIQTLELMLSGEGDFDLTERNRIGDVFTAGKLAADIDGSLDLLNDFDILIDDIIYTFKDASVANIAGVRVDAGASTGNLTLTTSNDDVSQTTTGSVMVEGLTRFDIGVGCVELNVSMGNDFNEVTVDLADVLEIDDSVGTMIVNGVTVDDQAMITGESIELRDQLNTGERLWLGANVGVQQIIGSSINANELIVTGSGLFELEESNNIDDGAGLGRIAVDVDGSVLFKNNFNTQIDRLSFLQKNGTETEIVGVGTTGDLLVEAIDLDVTQATDAAVIVGGTAFFDVGIGCVDLPFGDNDSDTVNDNDFNSLDVISASIVNVADGDGFGIGDSVVSDRARFESDGTIVVERDLRVTNQILFLGMNGMTQDVGSNIETQELLLSGAGDFVLDQLNSIGNSGTPAQLAAMIDGSLELKNDFGVHVASLSYLNKDTTTVDIVGVNLDNTTGSGDLTIDADDSDVTQDLEAPIIVRGLTTFDTGLSGNVNLVLSDTIDDGTTVNENDFNLLAVDNANIVELNDINDVTVVGIFANNQVAITSDTDEILVDGNVDVVNLVKFEATTGLSQLSGVVETSSLLLMGSGYFDLSAPNLVGGQVGTGLFAADVAGDINFVNNNAIAVSSLAYTDLAGDVKAAVGLMSTGVGTLNDVRVKADGIQLQQRTQAMTVVFETTAGIAQFDTQTTDGIIDANDFSLIGTGLANLAEQNLIGSNLGAGDVAIDFAGNVRLRSLFGVDFDDVTFNFKSGATRTDSGVNIAELGGAEGNLELYTGGHITDASDIDIFVEGRAALVVEGSGDIVLGDQFTTGLGPNNTTHFGTVGLAADNASLSEDSSVNVDGVRVSGDLHIDAFGHIMQTGDDPFSAVGTNAIEVEGDASFVTDGLTQPVDHYNDLDGQDIMLLARDNDEVIDNIFAGMVEISGSVNTGTLNGNGTLRNVQFRNTVFEDAVFPDIDSTADPLRSLTVWAPNSSLELSRDIDVEGSLAVFAGVDTVNGQVGGALAVTNALLNRKIIDSNGTDISVGRNATFESGNTIILANHSTNSIDVGRRFQTSTHGGDAGSRIRVGIADQEARGNDSGANVNVGQLRFRAKPTNLANSEHASFNIDNAVEITGPNVARSLMLVADGDITDDADADMNVKNSTTLIAENNGNIELGDRFSNNFINNNNVNLGTLAMRAHNADITEDSAILLDGIRLTGDLHITAMGNIRQSGQDRFGQVGTPFIEVDGDTIFRVDQMQRATDQVNDTIGQDVKVMTNLRGVLMNNHFRGDVTFTTTDLDNSNNRRGSLRNVEFRNLVEDVDVPTFELAGSDQVRNLFLWTPNSGLNFDSHFDVANIFRVNAGIDSINGLRNGRLQISDNTKMRNITDSAGISLKAGRSLDFRAANRIDLADQTGGEFIVDNRATLITLGGRQGNAINVGTSLGGVRGNDSGSLVDVTLLKYRAPLRGRFGLVTFVGDSSFSVTPDSEAQSAVILP